MSMVNFIYLPDYLMFILMRIVHAICFLSIFICNIKAVQQPDGTTIPASMGCSVGQPTGLKAVFACQCLSPGICNIGVPCLDSTSCDSGKNSICEETLWHVYNDNTCIPSQSSGIDVINDASLDPQSFLPNGTVVIRLASRENALFKSVFGWYNITGSVPATSDLHEVISCTNVAGDEISINFNSEPAYLGGKIGFFIITPESHTMPGTCPNGNCCATIGRYNSGEGYAYYSQPDYNPDYVGSDSYIHLLIYKSKIAQRRYYLTWNDIFNTGGTNAFTSVVASIDGVCPAVIPSVPILNLPIDSALSVTLDTTLSWSSSEEASTFGLHISSKIDFSDTILIDTLLTEPARKASGLTYSTTYYWRARLQNILGASSWSDARSFTTIDVPTTIRLDKIQKKSNSFLIQNYPNPFIGVTNIQYVLSERAKVTLKIFDILGNEITTLVNRTEDAGKYSVNFDGSALDNGTYFCSFKAGELATIKKLVILK
jgi:hypothetical protein